MTTKSFVYWKNLINQMDVEIFEDLCEHLLEDMEFYNRNIKKGGADEGRDIEAYHDRIEPDNITTTKELWFVECKRYTSGIGVDSIASKVNWAIAEDADYIAFMSNSHLTKSAKKWVGKMSGKSKLKVIYWTDSNFLRILFQYLQTVKYFFPDENIPERFIK